MATQWIEQHQQQQASSSIILEIVWFEHWNKKTKIFAFVRVCACVCVYMIPGSQFFFGPKINQKQSSLTNVFNQKCEWLNSMACHLWFINLNSSFENFINIWLTLFNTKQQNNNNKIIIHVFIICCTYGTLWPS